MLGVVRAQQRIKAASPAFEAQHAHAVTQRHARERAQPAPVRCVDRAQLALVKLCQRGGAQEWQRVRPAEATRQRVQRAIARAEQKRRALNAKPLAHAFLRAAAARCAFHEHDLEARGQQPMRSRHSRHAGADDCDAGGGHGRLSAAAIACGSRAV